MIKHTTSAAEVISLIERLEESKLRDARMRAELKAMPDLSFAERGRREVAIGGETKKLSDELQNDLFYLSDSQREELAAIDGLEARLFAAVSR